MNVHCNVKPFVFLIGFVALISAAGPMYAQERRQNAAEMQAVAAVPVVPRNMENWKISIANLGFQERSYSFRKGPAVEVKRAGPLVVRREKGSEFGISLPLTDDDREKLFLRTRGVINGIYLARPGRQLAYTVHNAAIYEVRLAHGSRAIRIELQNPEPYRMGIEGDLDEVVTILNDAIVRQGLNTNTFTKPWKLDDSYRDKCLGDLHERLPEELGEWSWVNIEMSSRTHSTRLQMHLNDRQSLSIRSGQDESNRDNVSDEERDAFYQCARLILNHFEFSNDDIQPVNDGIRFSIGIKTNYRSITAEFDDYAGLPADWRKSISKIFEQSRVTPIP